VSGLLKRQAVIAAVTIICVVCAVVAVAYGRPPEFIAFVFTCWAGAYIVAGAVGWMRHPDNPTGPMLLAVGLGGGLVMLGMTPIPALKVVKELSAGIATVILFGVVLASPAGRFASRFESTAWVVLSVTYLLAAFVVRFFSFTTTAVMAAAISVALFLLVIRRWQRASPAMRRHLRPVVATGATLSLIFLMNGSAQAFGVSAAPGGLVNSVDAIGRALIPFGFLAGLLSLQMGRVAIAGLVTELGDMPTPGRLRDALANALGDPTLVVGYWSPGAGAYLASDGSTVPLPGPGDRRGSMRLERDGRPMAVIVHDPALEQDPGLVAAVGAAVRLTVENERLTAEVASQLDEVRASRTRIVEAGDAERKRVERDLHDGAQQRLVSVTLALRLARAKLGTDLDPDIETSLEQASDEAKAALVELRELARGIHPQILTEAGLGPALQSLADRAPIDVSLVSGTTERFSAAVEGAAYFVVSEALANVAKYAHATTALVRTAWTDDQLHVEIADDGIGGANVASGSGLRGLADRLAAIDGSLEIVSPTGGGTRLLATIPAPAYTIPV
jgi:signal transduction histidine kinase